MRSMGRRMIARGVTLCVLWMGLGAGIAGAADDPTYRYIRADAPAGGDGTSWDRAWRELPFYMAGGGTRKSSQGYLLRGYTYYLADGVYPPYVFDSTTDGATPITIKKATAADHGTDTGWRSEYGDGVAEFTGPPGPIIRIRTSQWIIDGVVGFGDGSIQRHGIRVSTTNNSDRSNLVEIMEIGRAHV